MAVIVQKPTLSRHSLIPTLIGLAICYSFAYNYFLFNAVQNDVNNDAECPVTYAGDDHESPYCSEVRLFRAWHDADAMHDESEASLLAETPNTSTVGQQSAVDVLGKVIPFGSQEVQEVDATTSQAEEVAAAEQRRVQEAQLRREKFDELEKQVRASLSQHSVTPWAKHLMDDQKRMEAESAALERHHKDRVLVHWQADIDRLDSKIQALVHADAETPWKIELAKLKQLVQHDIGLNSSTSVGDDQKVFAIRHIQLDKLEEALRGKPRSNLSAPLAQSGSLAFEIKHLRARLELEMSTQAVQGVQGKQTAADIGDRTTKLENSLTDLLLHHKAWEEKSATQESVATHTSSSGRLRGAQNAGKQHSVTVESANPKPVAFMDKRLYWSSVTKLSHLVVTGAAHDVETVVSKSDVRHLNWGGFIPKVACITAISYSTRTKARMMYFIDNFKLQSYEGPKELVLVYNQSDTHAARLVRKYADGVYIKSVAARDARDFPSSAALRYGAWSTDADVVARWEFEEWHDPKRLSMQVRAMAATSKPACILQSTPDQSRKTDLKAEAFVQETSLIGERSWMKAYWQPFSGKENANVVSPPAAHLVQLAMTAPQPKKDESQGKPVSNFRATTTKEANQAVHEWTMDECLDLDTNATVLASNTEEAIDKNMGHDMSKMFHKLAARRRDITQRMVLLCVETTMKSELQEHIFKRQHLEQMLGIRDELDKHLSAVAVLYAGKAPLTQEEASAPVNA
mmetsp:Transcript_111762/g.193725  ORF Transcript_111762/g.193725 Transcript_111762/m.193725 type:complete len:743 (+) Transcript_111762:93-2321(+)